VVAEELLERAGAAAACPAEFLSLGHRVGPQEVEAALAIGTEGVYQP
jgi:hypothetical protein